MIVLPKVHLVTGGTGALGREIVGRLLSHDQGARVTLVVRASTDEEARRRLADVRRYVERFHPVANARRLRVVRGDVTRPGLGMDPARCAELTRRVTHIIHSAASVHLGQSLEAARAVNVEGTRQVIRFARNCSRLAVLSHVSTAYVAGHREGLIREDDVVLTHRFLNAYEQSKWEAERLVRHAAKRIPVLVFRPSIIVGHSEDGHLSCLSTIYGPLRAIVHGRITALSCPPSARLDLVPVDWVADAIARLTSAPRRHGAIYHLAAGWSRSMPVAELVDRCVEYFRDEAGRYRGAHKPRAVADRAMPRALADYLGRRKHFDDSNLRRDLGAGFVPVPRPDAYLTKLFSYCRDTGWGTSCPWTEPEPAPPRTWHVATAPGEAGVRPPGGDHHDSPDHEPARAGR